MSCLSANDARVIRQIIADREFYKGKSDEADAQLKALALSRDNWRSLYESEKNRADNVQGGRVEELSKEVGALRGALDLAKQQLSDDRAKISEQNAEIIGLKSSRKWYFMTGTALGAAGGFYTGYKLGNKTINVSQPTNQLGATFRF